MIVNLISPRMTPGIPFLCRHLHSFGCNWQGEMKCRTPSVVCRWAELIGNPLLAHSSAA